MQNSNTFIFTERNATVVFLTSRTPALCLSLTLGARDLSMLNFDFDKFALDIEILYV